MQRTLIIGCGNPLRGDDGLAWEAAERLGGELGTSGVEVLQQHQLTPELAEPVSQADLVIFVDARVDGAQGEVACRRIEANSSSEGILSHQLGATEVVALAEHLYRHAPVCYLVTMTGAWFGYSEELSASIQAALPMLIDCIKRLVDGASASQMREIPARVGLINSTRFAP